jgi:2-amino-4-hydroxy-6-hydroxymethyldihydropteridine diphosphokinase
LMMNGADRIDTTDPCLPEECIWKHWGSRGRVASKVSIVSRTPQATMMMRGCMRQVADGRWQMAGGRWQMADGRWQAVSKGMADGRWQVIGRRSRWQVADADGRWQMAGDGRWQVAG